MIGPSAYCPRTISGRGAANATFDADRKEPDLNDWN